MDRNLLATAIFPVKNEYDSLLVTIPFLLQNSKFVGEIIIVADTVDDKSFSLQSMALDKCKYILNDNKGVFSAIKSGVKIAQYSNIIICAADEIIPLIKFDNLVCELNKDSKFVSATRYAQGGKRYGGHYGGRIISRLINLFFWLIVSRKFSDYTTGFKGFRVEVWPQISKGADGGGWSCALKFSLNAISNNFRVAEVPIISLDRAIGGFSKFKLFNWTISYLRIIFN